MSLNIAYIIPGLKYAGGIIHVVEEAREMKKRGHRVKIFTPFANLKSFPYFQDLSPELVLIPGLSPDISYLPSPKHPGSLFKTLLSIKKMAKFLSQSLDKDIDLVVADWYWMVWGAGLARRNGGRFKIVLKIQNPPAQEIKGAVGWPFAFSCRRAVAAADYITTVSAGTKKAIKEYFHVDSYLIGNGVRDIFFKEEGPVRKDEFLRKIELPGRKIILYVGRLNRQKGIEVLFKAIGKLKNRYALLLLMAGGGDRKYYAKLSRRLGLDESIRWLGEISPERLPLIYQSADLFIFPSWFEGFGLPPLEAMASALPVIVTETEGVKEYAKPGVNCLMVKPGDVKGIVNAAVFILEDALLGRKLGEKGRETAREFSWTKVADRAELLYNQLTNRGL